MFSAILTQIEIPSPKECSSISGKCFKYNLQRNIQNRAFFLEEICRIFDVGMIGFFSESRGGAGFRVSGWGVSAWSVWVSGVEVGRSEGSSVGSSVVIRFEGFGFVGNFGLGRNFKDGYRVFLGFLGGGGDLNLIRSFRLIDLGREYFIQIKLNIIGYQECKPTRNARFASTRENTQNSGFYAAATLSGTNFPVLTIKKTWLHPDLARTQLALPDLPEPGHKNLLQRRARKLPARIAGGP